MIRKSFLALLLAGATVFSANAGTFTPADNSLTITTPSDNWKDAKDTKYWVSLSDGNNTIAVDRLEKGKAFPGLTAITENAGAISMDFYTTLDNNYVVKTLAALNSDLETLRKAAATMTIKEGDANKNIASSPVTYYITAKDGLRVRSGAGQESSILTTLSYGQPVPVIGFVASSGGKNAWARISYNNADAFVSADYISATPVNTATTTNTTTQKPQTPQQTPSPEYVTCSICGMVLKAGNDYRNHMLAAHPVTPDEPTIYCQYCGQYIPASEYDNHLSTYHPTTPDVSITCPYCGERVPEEDYDLHIQSHQEYTTCPYCGESLLMDNLDAHINTYHYPDPEPETVYYCSYCGQSFDSQEELMNHYCPGVDLEDQLENLPADYHNNDDN